MDEKVEITTLTFNMILTALEKIEKASQGDFLQHAVICNFQDKDNRDFCNCGIADCKKALDSLKKEDNYNGYFII